MVEAEDSDDDGIVGPEGKPVGLLGEHTSARMTVLLVEDDVVTCKLVADGLKACRYDVVLARNGRVALDIMASETGSKIDIILTDIKMPEVSGIELASEVMGKKGHPPIVVMSTDFHPDTVISALAAGASEFLCKPLKKESLLSLQRHTQLMPGKALSQQSEELNFANLETKAAAQPPQQAMQASKGSAFQSTQSGKRGADFIDIASTKRQRLPFQLRADGTSHSFPAAFQPGADRRQNEKQSAPIAIRDQSNMQFAAALEAQQAAAPMRNASWPPSTKSVAIESMGPSNSHQNPMLSRQTLFAGLNPKGSGLNLDIKPLQRVGVISSPRNYDGPLRSQERLPAVSAKAKSSGLQALRYSEHMSAFSPVFPRNQATMHNEDRRPHIFQTEGVPRSQHVGLQQHHALASLPMIASLNLPPLIAPQPVFYQALRAFQEASATQPKPVNTATANRKAAIERFRAKRTQRSFEKKVRYTSRQRLAENRPRLKGQFVKAASQSGELPEATPSTEMTSGNSSEAQP